jgi:hypothetical protein
MSRKVLLACGIAYSLLYAVINDVVAAALYDGYSRTSQAISELSATGAPTRTLLTALVPLFTALMIAFGIGVWKSADGNRALRVTGGLLVAHGATFPLWLLAPMTSREAMGATMPSNDVGHLVLTVVTILLIVSQVGFGATALGKRFRLYSLLTAITVLVFGALTGTQATAMAAGLPTPWLGLCERVSAGSWLLWLAVLATALLGTGREGRRERGRHVTRVRIASFIRAR